MDSGHGSGVSNSGAHKVRTPASRKVVRWPSPSPHVRVPPPRDGGLSDQPGPSTLKLAEMRSSKPWQLVLEEEDGGDFDISHTPSAAQSSLSHSPKPVEAKTTPRPRIRFPTATRQRPDRSSPPAPSSPDQTSNKDVWLFSDVPSSTTEAEEAWAQKYPVSVREMAKRKLFHRKAVFRTQEQRKRGRGE